MVLNNEELMFEIMFELIVTNAIIIIYEKNKDSVDLENTYDVYTTFDAPPENNKENIISELNDLIPSMKTMDQIRFDLLLNSIQKNLYDPQFCKKCGSYNEQCSMCIEIKRSCIIRDMIFTNKIKDLFDINSEIYNLFNEFYELCTSKS